jgi:hypothetical protein
LARLNESRPLPGAPAAIRAKKLGIQFTIFTCGSGRSGSMR